MEWFRPAMIWLLWIGVPAARTGWHYRNWTRGSPVLVALLIILSGCATDRAGNSPLILAAWRGDAETVAALLEAGANVNAANRQGLTALMASTWGKTGRGDVAVAKALIAKAADVNAANANGRTALMEVSGNGNLEFVNLLLNTGADPNARTSSGGTALHEAAVNGHAEVLRVLLSRGSGPNAANELGQTPLMLACTCAGPRQTCPERPEMVRLLLDAGARVDVRDAGGNTVWQWATGGTMAERDDVRRLLKAAGATEQ